MGYGDSALIKTKTGLSYTDLGLANDAAFDTLIDDINTQTSSMVDRYCDRDFLKHTDDTMVFDGNNRIRIRKLGYPVISITSVKIDGVLLAASEYRIKSHPLHPTENAGILEKRWSVWPNGWENIEVVYTWGFDTPPEVVSMVVEIVAVQEIKDLAARYKGKGAESMSMDGFSVSFDMGGEKLISSGIGVANAAYATILARLDSFKIVSGA